MQSNCCFIPLLLYFCRKRSRPYVRQSDHLVIEGRLRKNRGKERNDAQKYDARERADIFRRRGGKRSLVCDNQQSPGVTIPPP